MDFYLGKGGGKRKEVKASSMTRTDPCFRRREAGPATRRNVSKRRIRNREQKRKGGGKEERGGILRLGGRKE